jgi:hypothetical protein
MTVVDVTLEKERVVMRVLVCGGRRFADREKLFAVLDSVHQRKGISLIIHGGANGADALAGEWASERGIPLKVFHADWERGGRTAGPIRNRRMLEDGQPEFVVATAGGRGTAHMVSLAKKAGLFVRVIV